MSVSSDPMSLQLLKELVTILYNPHVSTGYSKNDRDQATKTLLTLQNHSFFLRPFLSLLEPPTVSSLDNYTLIFVIKTIFQLDTKCHSKLSNDVAAQVFPTVLNFLRLVDNNQAFQNQDFGRLIKETTIQAVCRSMRLAFVDFPNKSEAIGGLIAPDNQLQQKTTFLLVKQILREFSSGGSRPISTDFSIHSFKHSDCLDVLFTFILDSLQLNVNQQPQGNLSADSLEAKLESLKNILEFDFIGNGQSLEDSSDESITVLYIPKSWGPLMTSPALLERMFRLYFDNLNQGRICSLILHIIMDMVSIRRSLYQRGERTGCLKCLLQETSKIMHTKAGLGNQTHGASVMHNFCRLLYTIKNHYQLVDLTQPPEYPSWLNELKGFTCNMMNPATFPHFDESESQIIFYLLKLWSGIYVPVPYLIVRDQINIRALEQDDGTNSRNIPVYLKDLKMHMTDVITSFVRFFVYKRSSYEDELLSETTRSLFHLFAILCRPNMVLAVSSLTQALNELDQVIVGNLLATVSAIIGSDISKVGISVIPQYDACIVQLCEIGFGVLNLFTSRNAGEFAEVAAGLEFVKGFQRVYIESQAKSEAQARGGGSHPRRRAINYRFAMDEEDQMGERNSMSTGDDDDKTQLTTKYDNKLGTQEQLEACVSFIFNVMSSLNNFIESNAEDSFMILEECLETFYEISVGVTVLNLPPNYLPKLVQSSTLLLQSGTIVTLLTEPDTRDFPFLAQPGSLKSRSLFLLTLTKLLLTSVKESETKDQDIEKFLGQYMCLNVPIESLQPVQISCILRDWKGFAQGCSLPEEYEYCFSFWFPTRINLLSQILELAFNSNNDGIEDMLISATLKLSQELVLNKGSRMGGVSSANPAAPLQLISHMSALLSQLCSHLQKRLTTRIENDRVKSQNMQGEIFSQQGSEQTVLNNLAVLAQIGSSVTGQGRGSTMKENGAGGLMDMEELREAVFEVAGKSVSGQEKFDAQAEDVDNFKLNFGATGPGAATYLSKLDAKHIYNSCKVLLRILDARIVPYGAMEYYKDEVFVDAIKNVLKTAFLSDPKELLNHTKTMYSIVGLLETLSKKKQLMGVILKMDKNQFARLIGFLVFTLVHSYSQSEHEYISDVKQAGITCLNTISTVRALVLSGQVETSENTKAVFSNLYRNMKSKKKSYKASDGFTVLGYGGIVGYAIKRRNAMQYGRSFMIVLDEEEKIELRKWFGMYEESHANLFPQLLKLYLGILFSNVGRRPDADSGAPNKTDGMRSSCVTTTSPEEKVLKLVSKGLLPLILTCPQTFLQFRNQFLDNISEKKAIQTWLEKLREFFGDAIVEKDGVVVSNPAHFESALANNEMFADEVLQLCIELQDT